MGLIFDHLAFLAEAYSRGVCFDDMLTLGHQNLYLASSQARRLARATGADVARLYSPWGEDYADALLNALFRPKTLKSMDCSAFEGSQIVHDLNMSISVELEKKFDVVIDGGTLEHVFNFPVALGNCMRMVKPGGSLFILSMANNYAGHGFYQFSPELFFRALQPAYGYEIREVIVVSRRFPSGYVLPSRCYRVTDPWVVHGRVPLIGSRAVQVMVHAVRIGSQPPLNTFPIQSDYAAIHKEIGAGCIARKSRRGWVRRLPLWLREILLGIYERRAASFSNRRFYAPWQPLQGIARFPDT